MLGISLQHDVLGTVEPRPLILIVDDDTASVHQLYEVVRRFADVHFCLNGEEALRMIRERRPDLVLLDMELPGISGEQTCVALRRQMEPSELPVIFVTAYADPAREARALECGGNDFILKPFNPPVARARIETHLALKRRTDELLRLTHTDPLTGLANRRRFDLTLEREWRRAARNALPLSLLMIDIDHFKAYNDAFGHPQGDSCLRGVGRVLRDIVQRPGDLAARYGGEEFAVLLPHTDLQSAVHVGQRVHEWIAASPKANPDRDGQEAVSVSIGIGTFDPDVCGPAAGISRLHPFSGQRSLEAVDLLETADRALYDAKHAGRNRTVTDHVDRAKDADRA